MTDHRLIKAVHELLGTVDSGNHIVSTERWLAAMEGLRGALMRDPADALAAQPAAEPTCEHCGGTGEVLAHAENCRDDLCALNGDEHSCVGRVEPCSCAAQPARAGGDAPSPDAMVAKAWGRFEAEMQRLNGLKQRFFAYDEEVGFDTYDTAEQAQAAAEESIAQYRAGATDEWDSAVENVCWGVILGRPEEAEVGEPNDDGERAVDYRLAALAAAPQPAAAEDLSASVGTVDEYRAWADAAVEATEQSAEAEHVVDANKMVRPDHLVDLNKMFPPDFNALIGWLADEAHAAIRAAYPAVRTESLDRAVQSYFEAMQPAASTVPATDAQNPRFTMDEWQDHARKYKLRFDLAEMPTTNGGAAAPAAVERQPLPEAECIKLLKFGQSSVEMVRAIERAHGIGIGIGSSKEGGDGR